MKKNDLKNRIFTEFFILAVFAAAILTQKVKAEAFAGAFSQVPYAKMYFALNQSENVIKAYQDKADGTVAYCLSSNLESPDGNQGYHQANGSGRISSNGLQKVRAVIADGYPANSRYWKKLGIPEDAQRQVTQLALWSVLASLREPGSNYDYFAYENAIPMNLAEVDAASMFRTLAGNALSGKRISRSLKIEGLNVTENLQNETLSVSFTVKSENLDAYQITVSGQNEEGILYLDGKKLDGSAWQKETALIEEKSYTLTLPWKNNGDAVLVLLAKGYAEGAKVTVFEPSDGSFQTMGRVEKLKNNQTAETVSELRLPSEPGKLRIIKLDEETKEPLSGVRFGIFPLGAEETAKPICELITGEDGSVTSSYLEEGDYEVRELAVPEGYLRDTDAKAVTISVNKTAETTWTNRAATGKILLKKQPVNDGESVGDSILEGAVYEVCPASEPKKAVGQIITDNQGNGEIKDLPLGTYLIREIQAPEGYLKNSEEYEVSLSYKDDKTSVITAELTVKDERILQPVTLRKFIWEGERSEKPLAHAGFSFYLKSSVPLTEDGAYDLDAAEPAVIGKYGETVLYTDENGRLETAPLPYGIYFVCESEVPDGYEKCEMMEVIVGEDPGKELIITAANEKTPPEETEPQETKQEETEPERERTEEKQQKKEERKETEEKRRMVEEAPNTGDGQRTGFWTGIAGVMLLIFLFLIINNRKNKKKKEA